VTMLGSGIGEERVTPAPPPAPGEVQLLTGFDLRYTNGDHHIKTIGAMPRSGGSYDIAFEDRDFNDPMAYQVGVSYAQLPGTIVPPNLNKTCGGGSCTFALQPPPSTDYVFVLRGFRLSFLPDDPSFPFPGNCSFYCDHHISDVGIVPGNGNVTVSYADDNRDDDYSVEIAYAYVPRTLRAGAATRVGEVTGSGVGKRTVDIAATRAITGFRIRYLPFPSPTNPYIPDTHLLRFGYVLSSTGTTAYFGDENPETLIWKYELSYATFT
jgi:hypothetical protein